MDLDGRVVDGLESLRQRIGQRLRFPRGTWLFNPDAGTDSLSGHRVGPQIVAAVITDAITDEGGDEVVAVADVNVDFDADSRRMTYTATVVSVYGTMVLSGPVL